VSETLRHRRKVAAVHTAEATGDVADSIEVRMALLRRVDAGEITLEQAQADLKRLRRSARQNGKTTRSRVWRAA
jgi:hypothetical protein